MAKSIMIQGTCSNAGKSIITAGLCRIFLQDGFKVAPFKAQNMALNSFVTNDDLEMGRAQATQAIACKIPSDVRMNPILLKPNSDTGSQVIVMGKPIGNMRFDEYSTQKEKLKKIIFDAYNSLNNQFDIIVIEGAGSPAEINLKDNDIVNMHVAKITDSPVLLVGDIDKGGVFASFVGTIELLDNIERDLIKGFIINKFRGDINLLKPGLRLIEEKTGKKVFGVIPYIKELGLPDEDSVEFKKKVGKGKLDKTKDINIAVIDLSHISNFTDFDPFELEPDVNLYIVDDPEDLSDSDIIIIPGSKNVIGDMKYLKDKGFYKALIELNKVDRTIIGICGGYQILGKKIYDPYNIEGDKKEEDGIGLLDVTTTIEKDKTLKQVNGKTIDENISITGYEIHHGKTLINEKPFILRSDNVVLGCMNKNGNIWGTYIHGIFDNDTFRRSILNKVRIKKNLSPIDAINKYDIDHKIDDLARVLRKNLDIDSIYKLMGI